jgi:hypothetical protein
MKILYILKKDPDETMKKFIDIHKKTHDVSIVDMRENKNYRLIIELLETHSLVISL